PEKVRIQRSFWERAVTKIRVLVANRPRLMRELVMALISDQPDIEVLGEIKDDSELAEIVAESKPDFVIIALDSTERRPDICDAVFHSNPHTSILALAPERNSGILFWVVTNIRSKLIESSEEGILGALRAGAQSAQPA